MQVQDVRDPASVLSARCEVMVEAKTVVKIVMKRDKKESGVETILRRCNLGPA